MSDTPTCSEEVRWERIWQDLKGEACGPRCLTFCPRPPGQSLLQEMWADLGDTLSEMRPRFFPASHCCSPLTSALLVLCGVLSLIRPAPEGLSCWVIRSVQESPVALCVFLRFSAWSAICVAVARFSQRLVASDSIMHCSVSNPLNILLLIY